MYYFFLFGYYKTGYKRLQILKNYKKDLDKYIKVYYYRKRFEKYCVFIVDIRNLEGVKTKRGAIYALVLVCLSISFATTRLFNYDSEEIDSDTNDVGVVVLNDDEDIETPINNVNTTTQETNTNDIVGTIKITGTNINHYIVQGKDNTFYLNHNIYGKKDSKGSIFLDYRNKFDDRKLLIFGHNSLKNNTIPFHELEKYKDESFYKKYPYIDLTLDGKHTRWKIFSVMVVKKGDNTHMKVTFNDLEWQNHLKWLSENSIYKIDVETSINDRVLMLQTCNYSPKNTYLIISAKKM